MLSLNERLSMEKSFLIIFPDSHFKSIWDLLAFILIIYQSITLPFKICFEPDLPSEMYYFDLMQDLFFMVDILVNFQTGIYQKGLLIM